MMKKPDDSETFLPPALLAEVEAMATHEHRPAKEIMAEAISLYLKQRRQGRMLLSDHEVKARAFRAWIYSHSPSLPILSDDALRRENMIRDGH